MATAMAAVTATAMVTVMQCRHCPSSLHRCHHHVSHCCAPPPSCHLHLNSSPPLHTPPFSTHHGHHCWLIVVCLWVGGASPIILSSLALSPPFPPSSLSPFTYLACPTIACHVLLDHHGWFIIFLKGSRRGECAFYCYRWVAGWSPGRKLCMHASYFDITAPAAKNPTNRDCQGMLKVIQHALTVAK